MSENRWAPGAQRTALRPPLVVPADTSSVAKAAAPCLLAATSGGRSGVRCAPVPSDFAHRLAEIQLQPLPLPVKTTPARAQAPTPPHPRLFHHPSFLFADWAALYLAKQVTVPIEALCEGTREVLSATSTIKSPSKRKTSSAPRQSFNAMTRSSAIRLARSIIHAQSSTSRAGNSSAAANSCKPFSKVFLLPSFADADARNRAHIPPSRYLGPDAPQAETLDALLGPESSRVVQNLMRRPSHGFVVARSGKWCRGPRSHAAVTVSSLGPRRANSGYVLVVDDLHRISAQKSAAWQEVARRSRTNQRIRTHSDSTFFQPSPPSQRRTESKPPSRSIPN